MDRIDADRVGEFHTGLVERLHADAPETLAKIKDGDWSDETQNALRDSIETFVGDFGYDLDEEGQPLSEDDALRSGEGRKSSDEGRKSSDEGRTSEEPAAVAAGS